MNMLYFFCRYSYRLSEMATNQISIQSNPVFLWTSHVGMRGFFLRENKALNKPGWILLMIKREIEGLFYDILCVFLC